MTDVWVAIAPAARQTDAVNAELIGEARRLAGGAGHVRALLVGGEVERDVAPLAPWGPDEALVIAAAELENYHPERYARAIAAAVRAERPRAILFAGTVLGNDLGARVAVELGERFHPSCVNFELDGEAIRVTRNVERSRFHQVERAAGTPALVSLVPNTVGSGAPGAGRPVPVRRLAVPIDSTAVSLRDLGFTAADPRTMDLVDADVIVSGGRGMGGPEGFRLLEEIADHLGGSVGASRPAVEAGWAPYERQVGQTGRTVKPKLYMACGISGATQHLAGMRDAQVIIAINTDANAPILGVATLGVEGDLNEILVALAALLRRRVQVAAA